jgi:hypothetical protein
MKYIRRYNNFREIKRLNESEEVEDQNTEEKALDYSFWNNSRVAKTIESVGKPGSSLAHIEIIKNQNIPDDPTKKEILSWVRELVPKLFKPHVSYLETMKLTDETASSPERVVSDVPWFGEALRFLTKNRSILSYETDEFFQKYNILGADDKPVRVGQPRPYLGKGALNLIEDDFSKRFPGNPIPFKLVKYIIERVRKEVADELKVPLSQFIYKPTPTDDLNKDVFFQTENQVPDELKNLPFFCFKTEAGSKYLPTLSKKLVDCGGRDLRPEGKKTNFDSILGPEGAGVKAKFKAVAEKKKMVFVNWLKSEVISNFSEKLSKISESDLDEYIAKNKLSKKTIYEVGDEVFYLRKGKTIEDYKNLKVDDTEKEKEVIAKGKITKFDEDKGEYTLEAESGKVIQKTTSQLIKKIEKNQEEDEEEEEKNPEEEEKKLEKNPEEKSEESSEKGNVKKSE